MKKWIALLVGLAVCLVFVGCGEPAETTSSNETALSSENVESQVSQSSSEPKADAPKTNTNTTKAIENYIGTIQDQMDQLTSAMQNSGMNISLKARGNSLVFSYQYDIDIEITDQIKSALEQALSSMSSFFETSLTQIQQEIPEVESVIVEYCDKEGNLIISKEFKSRANNTI